MVKVAEKIAKILTQLKSLKINMGGEGGGLIDPGGWQENPKID